MGGIANPISTAAGGRGALLTPYLLQQGGGDIANPISTAAGGRGALLTPYLLQQGGGGHC